MIIRYILIKCKAIASYVKRFILILDKICNVLSKNHLKYKLKYSNVISL